jgi:raffinose/stachyose/melibiose transport system permease protein
MDTVIRKRSNWLVTGLLLCSSLAVLLPLYFTFITAVKTKADMRENLWLPPQEWQWGNFTEAIRVTNFGQSLTNSLIITASVVVLTVLTNSMVGYAIARNMHRRPFKALFFYFLSAMFIPFPIVMLPLVKQMSFLGLDNRWGLILLYVVYQLSFNVLLYSGYMKTIPETIEEAAKLDGASTWQTFWRIIFPLLTPVNATVAILTGLAAWNDFLLPLVVLSDASEYTLPLAQYAFQGQFSTNYNLAFASYLMAMTPMLIVYLFAQRWIIAGVTRGAVK